MLGLKEFCESPLLLLFMNVMFIQTLIYLSLPLVGSDSRFLETYRWFGMLLQGSYL